MLSGEDAVKAAGEKYLPRLDSQSEEEYADYKARASFFGATARTLEEYLDLIFRRAPADRPVLLCGGGAEVVTPKLASSDLQFLANRKFSCTEICSAFGVPEEIITTTNAAKYDVMSGARLNFIENRVVPLCRRLEAEDDVTVKAIDPKADGWFDPEDHPVMAAARRDRLAAARTGFDMGIPFNELNRSFDLGFKPLPWGDKGYVPTAMQPADAGNPKSEGPKAEGRPKTEMRNASPGEIGAAASV